MASSDELKELQARVAELEARNEDLSRAATGGATTAGDRARSALAAVLVIASILLAPIAVLGGWARIQLVDTDRFVETFAPLAEHPEVQALVADEAARAIEESLDIDGLVSEVFRGLDGLGLPPRTSAALQLLEGPAAAGVKGLIDSGVERVVASPQFARIWEGALRASHSRAIAVIQGDPDALIQLSDEGAISLSLGVVIEEAKRALVQQGVGFAERIPVVDRSIPIVASDSLALVRTFYQLAVAAGYWLPWLVLGLFAGGVALARRRTRALAWGAIGMAVSLLLLSAGIGTGRLFFVGTVSPSIMPASTAGVVFDQLTILVSASVLALIALSAFIAIGAWAAGSSRSAVAVRGAADSGFSAVRGAADRHGLDTRGVGRFVERWRVPLAWATAVIGALALFLSRPISIGGVIGTLVAVLAVLVLIELLRRPPERA